MAACFGRPEVGGFPKDAADGEFEREEILSADHQGQGDSLEQSGDSPIFPAGLQDEGAAERPAAETRSQQEAGEEG